MLSEWLLRTLVCPKTHAPVVRDGEWLVSTDAETRLRYPIKDEIPYMTDEDAEAVPEEEWLEIMERSGQSEEERA